MTERATIILILIASVVLGAESVRSQGTTRQISAADLKAHVKYLSSDELEGRAPGTEGNRKAAEYIARFFEKYGLRPAGDQGTFYQSFEFTSGVELGEGNTLRFSGPGLPPEGIQAVSDRDFRPLGFSSSSKLNATLVFAGFGISASDLGYDDYQALDVAGKVVAVLRYTPAGNDPHSDMYKYGSFRTKARIARDRGAVALIVISSPDEDSENELVKLSFDQSSATSGIPVLSATYTVFDKVLATKGLTTAMLEDSIKSANKPVSLDLSKVEVDLAADVHLKRSATANIMGYLPPNPDVEGQIVVMGAHMDHLGWGGPGSGSLEPDSHEIHNGADDNASGSAGLLELAEYFSTENVKRRRGLLFIAFSGEEIGTLGSSHYVEDPAFPLNKTAAMINLDMIGRLRENSLTVYGSGTSPQWKELLSRTNKDSTFHLSLVDDGYGPSDHAPFYGKDIPVLFFFTGSHNEYHKPEDDWETINYEGAETVVRFVSEVALEIAESERSPEFARVKSSMPQQTGSEARAFKVTLGVIPDYSAEGEGMKIGGIRPGGPAEKAGLEAGDVIVGMKGKKVLNIYDYMGILGELKEGEVVNLEILRGNERKTFTATMQPRQ